MGDGACKHIMGCYQMNTKQNILSSFFLFFFLPFLCFCHFFHAEYILAQFHEKFTQAEPILLSS